MNNIQQILRILNPVIKGFPLIIGLMAALIFIASKMVFYATPLYETTGRMKLEDVNMGISNTNLFKNFDVFTEPNKIMAEVEVIKSTELLKTAISKVPFDISYYRIGKIRTTELYFDTPFKVVYTINDPSFYGRHFFVTISDTLHYTLKYSEEDNIFELKKSFNEKVQLSGIEFTIQLNDALLKAKPTIKIQDEFYFTINSMEQMVEEVSKNVDVKEMDKDVPILRITYKNAVPEKAMIFTNILMETYIQEGIRIKTGAAQKTVEFIDGQMQGIAEKLEKSERELENYRLDHKITNNKMEIETSLKKIAEMKIQLANIDMNLASLEAIDNYVNTNDPDDFIHKAPNFEGYGGLLYTELIKRLKVLQSDKKQLLQKYTPENEKVIDVESDIQDVVSYIKKNVSNARNSMELQRNTINAAIIETEKEFKDVPTKEKELIILERNFQLNQNIYNFLTEKRTESSIAEAATMSFHRIIQKAELPQKPVSPKKTFTILVFAFLGLLSGIAIVYIYDAISARIKYKDELEKASSCPVIGDIRHDTKETSTADFLSLASKLNLKSADPHIFLITSSIDGEGKTFIAEHLANAFAAIGIKTLLVYSDLRERSAIGHVKLSGKTGFTEYITGSSLGDCIYPSSYTALTIMPSGISTIIPEAIFAFGDFEKNMKLLKKKFDVIICDSPSFDTAIDALPLMKVADTVLYIFRANYSKTKLAIEPDVLKAEHGFEHISLLLNDVPDFTKRKRSKGIRYTLKSYYRILRVFTKKIIKR